MYCNFLWNTDAGVFNSLDTMLSLAPKVSWTCCFNPSEYRKNDVSLRSWNGLCVNESSVAPEPVWLADVKLRTGEADRPPVRPGVCSCHPSLVHLPISVLEH
jgi:hypothetical protein